jgi:hypothetical protein
MDLREALEIASYAVTVIGLPFAVVVFLMQQRRERENEEEEGYQLLSDAYNDFLKVVLANADLQLRSQEALAPAEQRRWNSWDDYMREWCRRDDFFHALPLLLRGEDPAFQDYIRRVAHEERGAAMLAPT